MTADQQFILSCIKTDHYDNFTTLVTLLCLLFLILLFSKRTVPPFYMLKKAYLNFHFFQDYILKWLHNPIFLINPGWLPQTWVPLLQTLTLTAHWPL